jgi:hypothetical protein
MNIKMLVGLSGNEYSLAPGDEYAFPDAEARRLIEAGYAVKADTETPEPAAPAPPAAKKKGKANVVSPEGGDATD